MIDIFDDIKIDTKKIICHTGGADGSDTYWENIGEEFGVKIRAYSYKTPSHTSSNKVEVSESDYQEGIIQVNKANHWLNRFGIQKYMNLLARNWCQIKYSSQVIAIGTIIRVGEKSKKGYYNRGKYDIVDGGTAWAVQMGIDNNKPIFVFDQIIDKWFRWSYTSMSFVESDCPKISVQNFSGIGTREILPNGIKAIRDVYNKTFNPISDI